MFRGIMKRLVATSIVAASLFLATVFLGLAIFYGLGLILTPLGAAAVTFVLFAVVALIVALVFLKGDDEEDDEDEEPEGIAGRVLHLVREHPVLGAVGGLGAAFMLLRNPALAAIIASMVAERKMDHGGYGKRRRR